MGGVNGRADGLELRLVGEGDLPLLEDLTQDRMTTGDF
jgi:hypothetical protein